MAVSTIQITLGGFVGSDLMREKLHGALRKFDDRSRDGRVDRIIWLGEHEHLPPVIAGRTETLHILNEARETFINGHFAAALVLSVAVIEHSLVEELQLRGAVKERPKLSEVLAKSEEHSLVPVEWFPSIRQLVARRNPFAHLKSPTHIHGLGARVMREKLHPRKLLEQDARSGIEHMYKVFRATLREST